MTQQAAGELLMRHPKTILPLSLPHRSNRILIDQLIGSQFTGWCTIDCIKESSRLFAMKRIDQFGWKRCEKSRRELNLAFRQAYRTIGFAASWERTNFRHWNVPLTQKNCLSPREFFRQRER